MQKNACISCRTSKLRCSLDTFAEHGKCRRCFKISNECVFKTIAPRQRRKRTDTRVAALEQRLAELQAVVNSQRVGQFDNGTVQAHTSGSTAHVPQPASQDASGAYFNKSQAPVEERKWLSETEDEKSVEVGYLQSSLEALLTSGLLSTDTAVRLFDDFTQNVLPQYPILLLSSAETFEYLRRQQPTLLLAMITAACRGSDPDLFRKLHFHLRGDLSEQVMVCGNRSVELVQAILVMVEWYDPPEDMRRLIFYTWIQIASVMVRELGLWPWSEDITPVEHTATEWRTSFAAYLSISTAAVSLRRPMPIAWTEGMRKGLDAFGENSVQENDKRLVEWVRLQMIAEEVETSRIKVSLAPRVQIGADQPSPVDQHTISLLEGRFGKWRDAAQPVLNGSLRMHFFYCRIKFYELAVACRPTWPASHIGMQPPALAAARDMVYIRTIMSLIQSSHSALDTLVLFDIATYRRCPTFISIRALYALQEIFTVWKSVYHQRGDLSEFVNDEVLALKFYARQTELFFRQAAGTERFTIPQMALNALPNVLLSLEDMRNRKRLYRMQQPEPLGQEIQQGAAIKAPSPIVNDLEVTLIIDLGNFEAPSVNQGQDQDQDQDGTRSVPDWPATTSTSDSDDLDVTLGDALLAPELGTMTVPCSVIDPAERFNTTSGADKEFAISMYWYTRKQAWHYEDQGLRYTKAARRQSNAMVSRGLGMLACAKQSCKYLDPASFRSLGYSGYARICSSDTSTPGGKCPKRRVYPEGWIKYTVQSDLMRTQRRVERECIYQTKKPQQNTAATSGTAPKITQEALGSSTTAHENSKKRGRSINNDSDNDNDNKNPGPVTENGAVVPSNDSSRSKGRRLAQTFEQDEKLYWKQNAGQPEVEYHIAASASTALREALEALPKGRKHMVDVQKRLEKKLGVSCQDLTESCHYRARCLYGTIPHDSYYHSNNVMWMLHSTYWYKGEAMFNECCHVFNTAVREAQELGFNREEASEHLPEFERDMRRRAWCVIDSWDWQIASGLGRGTIIDHDTCNALRPSLTLEHDGKFSPLMHMNMQSDLIHKLAKRFKSPGNIQAPGAVLEYKAIMDEWMLNFPPVFALENPDTSHDKEQGWIEYHRHYNYTMGFMMVLNPFRHLMRESFTENASDELLELRTIAVEVSLSIVRVLDDWLKFLTFCDGRFHFIIFSLVDVTTILSNVLRNDKVGTVSHRDDIYRAVKIALVLQRRMLCLSMSAKMGFRLIQKMARQVFRDAPREHLAFMEAEPDELAPLTAPYPIPRQKLMSTPSIQPENHADPGMQERQEQEVEPTIGVSEAEAGRPPAHNVAPLSPSSNCSDAITVTLNSTEPTPSESHATAPCSDCTEASASTSPSERGDESTAFVCAEASSLEHISYTAPDHGDTAVPSHMTEAPPDDFALGHIYDESAFSNHVSSTPSDYIIDAPLDQSVIMPAQAEAEYSNHLTSASAQYVEITPPYVAAEIATYDTFASSAASSGYIAALPGMETVAAPVPFPAPVTYGNPASHLPPTAYIDPGILTAHEPYNGSVAYTAPLINAASETYTSPESYASSDTYNIPAVYTAPAPHAAPGTYYSSTTDASPESFSSTEHYGAPSTYAVPAAATVLAPCTTADFDHVTTHTAADPFETHEGYYTPTDYTAPMMHPTFAHVEPYDPEILYTQTDFGG
ncbi:hypothetical protein TARUN_6350 [Trichoderma arundinaceum]|uniref:Zn(2)-C6 fungal-type domain-containing protein n=1 Tax=Trichoderma arundinaceum TaxID=490622 RepID=A0A395NIH6_TRIAR|nr:hypothetical protein TARUN_6350 [Trichoderma arundinaceum]